MPFISVFKCVIGVLLISAFSSLPYVGKYFSELLLSVFFFNSSAIFKSSQMCYLSARPFEFVGFKKSDWISSQDTSVKFVTVVIFTGLHNR